MRTLLLLAVVVAALVVIAFALAPLDAVNVLTPAQPSLVTRARALVRPHTQSTLPARSLAEQRALLDDSSLARSLSLASQREVRILSSTQSHLGVWRITTDHDGSAHLVVTEHGVMGYLLIAGEFHQINTTRDQSITITRIAFRETFDHDSTTSGAYGTHPPDTNPACATDSVLSVLVLASTEITGIDEPLSTWLDGVAREALDNVDQAFATSRVNARVDLAGTALVDFNATTSMTDDVKRLSERTDVQQLRAQTGADMVVAITAHAGGGESLKILPSYHDAYAVVSYKNVNSPRFTFAHEIGHLLGGRHDTSSDPLEQPFKYGHGAANTIACSVLGVISSCTYRELLYSNPDINWPRTTKPAGNATWAHNARALTETLPYAMKFGCIR